MQTTVSHSTHKKTTIFSAYHVVWVISVLFILLFVYTAVAKLRNPDKFYGTLHGSQLVKPFASFLTYAVPITELFICVLLLFNSAPLIKRNATICKIGFIAAGTLMLSFTVYIGLMFLLYGNDLPCSCGGVMKELSWTAHIFFNLAFVGLAIWALVLNKRINKR